MYKQIEQDKVFNFLNKIVELVENFREEVAASSTGTVEEIIEHEGLKLKRVDREAKNGDYIRMVGLSHSDAILKDKIYGPIENGLVESKEEDFNEKPWPVYDDQYNRTPSTVEVFEVIDVQAEKLPFPEVELTANQKRAALIEKAKKFITNYDGKGACTGREGFKVGPDKLYCDAEFVVNKEKRTVVCLMKRQISKIVSGRGIAKCDPNDVFNEHICKAIALARALEIDVPEEFLKAVQPEIAVGQVVYEMHMKDMYIVTEVLPEIPFKKSYATGCEYEGTAYQVDLGLRNGWSATNLTKILDDTNAQYKDI